jgi:hypothetical protein
MMNMSGTGGYILHAFKMYVILSSLAIFTLTLLHLRSFDDPDAQGILVHRQKKRKVEKPVEPQLVTEPTGDDAVMAELTEGNQTSSGKSNIPVL